MRSSNPALPSNLFQNARSLSSLDRMTTGGTVAKTAILLLLVLLTSGFTFNVFLQSGQNPAAVMPYMIGGAIGGFIFALISIFKKEWIRITAPIYALMQGLFIGGISSIFEVQYPGIVFQGVTATFGTLAAMLFVYQSKLIPITDSFRFGVVAATGGIAVVYFFSFILSFFGMTPGFIYQGGLFGILFSLFVVAIASLNLLLDLDFIDQGVRRGAPKMMEWYGAFALMVTLIWLYIEFLRLLSKVRSR